MHIIGMDMSSAFDTIDRAELISVLEKILDEDEVRMCRLLLSDTKMKLRFDGHTEETFSTNKGSPQGDAISGVFFNVAFEHALRDLRETLFSNNPHIEHSYSKPSSNRHLPSEIEYADDADFPNSNKSKNDEIKQ